MAEQTAIEWTDATFNPWIGCTKISPACDHCYAAELMDTRYGRVKWGGPRSRTSDSNWQQPRRWQRQADSFFDRFGRRRRVFCASLADVFDNQVPDAWREDLWALIRDTPDLDWQLLTKRPMNIAGMLPAFWDEVKGHVWLGATVEDQRRVALNVPHLLDHDSAVRFISAEPLLGQLGLDNYLRALPIDGRRRLDWVIAGGESGPKARPSHPDWFRSLRDQCAGADVPFLLKQWGEWVSVSEAEGHGPHHHFADGATVRRIGKKLAGRTLDGVEHNGFPEVRL
jgi:protein gp37